MTRITLILLICLIQTSIVTAQFSTAEKREVISLLDSILKRKYIFPETAIRISEQLNKNLENGVYDTIHSKRDFAFALNREARSIANDLHFKISYEEKVVAVKKDSSTTKATEVPFEGLLRENNFGIKTKDILTGNIGYLEVPLFGPIEFCADTIIKAMNYVQDTDALIIDLRTCRGALDENTVLFFLSYFFREPIHLSDLHIPEEKLIKQSWTYAWVPGRRYVDKPVYILTSGRTFSGGEAFAYDLQQFKRAIIVGATTRGGAHLSEFIRLNNSFTAVIPYARPVNIVSNSNWEHTGVIPDSIVNTNVALYDTHLMAASQLLINTTDSCRREQLSAAINSIKETKPRFRRLRFSLKGYAHAKEVAVAGSFNSYSRNSFFLKKTGDEWEGEAEVLPGDVYYSFLVDGNWIIDPANEKTIRVNEYIYSLKIVP